MIRRHSVEFFEPRFQQHIANGDLALNPFETLALEHVRGDVLDFGCGLGNFALAAARRGHRVRAIDGSATAIRRIRDAAAAERLAVTAEQADIGTFELDGTYDRAIAIGLFMFFARDRALALLAQLQRSVRPGGVAVVNVLTEGTTFLDMFDPTDHYLFRPGELEELFDGWRILVTRADTYPAAGETLKVFATVVAAR
ncbi:MAG: class I SAM-dependent methyltransferase [Planctomycetota bacterium]|nr:MAG: class I SAM-dependent methyltransferase [Planctomycetota bacterium]